MAFVFAILCAIAPEWLSEQKNGKFGNFGKL